MNRVTLIVSLTLLSVAACGGEKPGAGAAGSAAPAASAVKAAEITCDAVAAKLDSLGGKMDADAKKVFMGMCAGHSQAVRACFMAAKTLKDVDGCDPNPLKGKGSASPAASGAVPAAPAELVEHDLSGADPTWKGWVAKGPKDAKVMADGVKGARIAANGADAFDLTFAPTKTKLADTKKGIEAGKKLAPAGTKITIGTDTADKLEWTSEMGSTKTFFFTWNLKASGKDVTCATGPMGASSEAQLKTLQSACESLKKK